MPNVEERLIHIARDARDRAEEILVLSDRYVDPDAKRIMIEIADGYIKLAERLEKVGR